MGAGGTGGIGYSNKWTPARGIGTTMATRQIHNSNGVIGGAPASLGAGESGFGNGAEGSPGYFSIVYLGVGAISATSF